MILIGLDFRFPLIPKARILVISVKTVEELGRQACLQIQAYVLGCHPENISQFTSNVDHVTASNT